MSTHADGVGGPHGAYGLRLTGLTSELLVRAEANWPMLEIVRRVGLSTRREDALSEERAAIVLLNGGEALVERHPLRAIFTVPSEIGDAALVHPYLASVAAIAGHWLGHESFHAGGIVMSGKAFGVLGRRQAGKSSLLAWLALHGQTVLSDDIVMTDGSIAFAGPRSIDLRAEAAERLEAGVPLGLVGARERWRLRLDPIEPTARLGGWVFPTWGPEVRIKRLTAAERLVRIAQHRAVLVPPAEGGLLLRLAERPAWELQRPKAWETLPDAAAALLEALGAR